MSKIDRKKVILLNLLVLLITASLTAALLLTSMNEPTSAQPAADTINLHGPNLTPTHMHYTGGILDLSSPMLTDWHELHPGYCQNWRITDWEDNGDLQISPSDQIEMTNLVTQAVSWFHVDRITWTLKLWGEDYQETIYIEYKGPYDPPIGNPVCTFWHEVWPTYHGVLEPPAPYHIGDWMDNGNGYLDVCDYIMFDEFPGFWYHVEEMATDLILNEKITDPVCTDWLELYPEFGNWYHIDGWTDNDDGVLSPCDYVDLRLLQAETPETYHVENVTLTLVVNGLPGYYFEYNGTFETIYDVKTNPVCTYWDEIYPGQYEDFHLGDWIDNCNGVLDTCDDIMLEGEWVHVEELAIDIVVKKEPSPYECVLEDGYKPRFNDYAQSGMPDFDQKQDIEWSVPDGPPKYTYCGPTAVANSLWWMDSRFEDPASLPPPTKSDSFIMVTRYNLAWDDHDPQNVEPFVEDLAWYMDTDGQRTASPHTGTRVQDMYDGIIQYLTDRGLKSATRNIFDVNMYPAPEFTFVESEVERCQDVILLLGFWQEQMGFVRVGGHYVTVSGVWSDLGLIAFSDPYVNYAEAGAPGRVLPYPHTCTPTTHNNATFVSHEQYAQQPSFSPGGVWGISSYDYPIIEIISNFAGQNPGPDVPMGELWDPMQYPIHIEVEYMITVCPIEGKEVFPGDANGDGFVSGWDLSRLSDAWMAQIGDVNFDPSVDFNFDGFNSGWDLSTLSDQWMKAAPS